jgi:anti-sigma B factor antagonist
MSEKHAAHWLEREDVGTITVVRLKPPKIVDEDVIRWIFELILKLVDEMGRRDIVLNFAEVEIFPSLALGKLVMLNRKLKVVEGRLTLCQLPPSILENLQNTRLVGLFKIYATEAEAIESLT